MAISATRNKNYGGAVVTQKYSPLENITYVKGKAAEYSALFTNRLAQLTNANLLPQPLTLITDWNAALLAVTGHDPPIVVISSNRSKWIAKGMQMAGEQYKIRPYAGSGDLKALLGNVGKQTQSPPLYSPLRTEGDRRVYVVVHALEYTQYKTALADAGITVVGWSFRAPTPTSPVLTGFGASRYAAIEFCKHLRANMAGVKWDYAWLLDDNVMGITGFPGYEVAENAMRTASATTEQVCSAFKGCANVESFSAIKAWATEKWEEATALTPLETPRGIIQQAALWNIKYLAEKKLNFSPIFVASGEDVSMGNYLNAVIPKAGGTPAKAAIPYLYYGGMKIRKEIVEKEAHDESPGAIAVKTAKDAYAAWFAAQEATPTPRGGTAPPPVQIETTRTETVSAFITTWFNSDDPDVKPLVAGKDPTVQATAKCQAVEQVACGAIWRKKDKDTYESCVNKPAVDAIFEVPGAGQVIVQQQPPP